MTSDNKILYAAILTGISAGCTIVSAYCNYKLYDIICKNKSNSSLDEIIIM
jgi:hypothetical protein